MDSIDAFKVLIKSDKPLLVDFYSTSCGPCHMLNPTLKEIKDTLKERISIVRIDIDKYQAIATLYRIKEVPTMMLFQNDKQLWRQSGVLSKIEILEIIMGKSMWPELPGQGK